MSQNMVKWYDFIIRKSVIKFSTMFIDYYVTYAADVQYPTIESAYVTSSDSSLRYFPPLRHSRTSLVHNPHACTLTSTVTCISYLMCIPHAPTHSPFFPPPSNSHPVLLFLYCITERCRVAGQWCGGGAVHQAPLAVLRTYRVRGPRPLPLGIHAPISR